MRTKNQYDRKVQLYVASALARSTREAYASDLAHFRAWGGRIPATPQMVARYLVAHASVFKVATLQRRLAAISSAHAQVKRPSPARSALVVSTMRGIRRMHGAAQKQARALELVTLKRLVAPLRSVHPLRDLRDRTLLLIGFAGGFRRSELVTLTPADVRISASGIILLVRRSKTDQEAKGRVVEIPRRGGRSCPVKLLSAWLLVLAKKDPLGQHRPLFRRIDRYGCLGEGLQGPTVGEILRMRMKQVGADTVGISAHSLRAGLVTEAARAGVPTWAIQRQTGQRSEATVHRYIRKLEGFERNAFKELVGGARC
ncbi:site-specific integrase [Variovorax sp. Sphag1AA]|uniref:site-specific integrase n=1 Tax=Variovorax sp. Sphag1AA TaxID=2587027 RepID=UPI0018354A23|nr:site-specific integrase [Variovorax sp. Sphag1AA]MBB3178820.1 integrase [Variovorax sp. Sphag1AA]